MEPRKQPVPVEIAMASEVFDQFCCASTLKTILGHYRHLCDLLRVKPTAFPQFYPKLKAKLRSWKAQALWVKFDKRASHKCYNRGKACPNTRVMVIGAGPCGLRTAIEAQLLGAKVVVVEKRDRYSRNNVLHLWPFVIQDLRALGAKKFFGKFCAGSIDHISIRQLQCILLKVALILGVEIHEGVGFEGLLPPPEEQAEEKVGWRAQVSPPEHPVSQYEFDVLIGADGKRNTLEGFKRKEFRGKLAIAITANFINRRSEAEARVEEISGVAFIFNQKFFKDLYAKTGIDLENIVYYKDETHYFVMTAKKHSLIEKGVIIQDFPDTAKLLASENVDKAALKGYAREAADFSTNYMLPEMEFAVNHYGQPDVAMFDFTSMFAAENASRVEEKHGYRLLQILVGDSLLEPFWPTGSGCARGFLSSMDACWAVKSWGGGHVTPLEVLAERESVYRILGQTTPENLQRDYASYTLDPSSRYPNLNSRCVLPIQARGLYNTDDPAGIEQPLVSPTAHEMPKKRRRKVKDSQVHPDTLLHWLKKQVALYGSVKVEDMSSSFKSGLVLCAIIHRYRPDLVDFHSLRAEDVAANNQLAFDTLERELGITAVMTGQEMEECEVPDKLDMLSYLSQIYDTFRGEIPHIKHPKLEEPDMVEDKTPSVLDALKEMNKEQKVNLLVKLTSQHHNHQPRTSAGRKRYSTDKDCTPTQPKTDTLQRRQQRKRRTLDKYIPNTEERRRRWAEIEQNRLERQIRRQYLRKLQTQQFHKSVRMLQANSKREGVDEEPAPFEDYSIFLYRQTADDFEDRVKALERKLLYPDRPRTPLGNQKGDPDEDFSGRIKTFEEKLRGNAAQEKKKPKDLYRAIGKIEADDWNVKAIEKKILENKMGRVKHERPEKVPKWSREQFNDKFQAVKSKLQKKSPSSHSTGKHSDIAENLKHIDRKLNEEAGPRGSNKVSAMAEQFAVKTQPEPDKPSVQRSNSRAALVLPAKGSSETCHFCNKRVYLMERISAEGKYFHRGCFRCEYCNTGLRLGNYSFDRDGKLGSRFFCLQHVGYMGSQKVKQRRKSDEFKFEIDKENIPSKTTPPKAKMPEKAKSLTEQLTSKPAVGVDVGDVNLTPERIEFENLTAAASDVEEAPSEMDEDEWTDRNFGASAAEGSSSDSSSGLSDSEGEANEVFEEALDQPLPVTADATRLLAETWSRRYSGKAHNGDEKRDNEDEEEEDESESLEDKDSDGESYQEYDSDDDESETATEGEEDIKALRVKRREELPKDRTDSETGSDTEIASDEGTSSESESSEVQNSATEIETDSEFEHDGTTPTHEIPTIYVTTDSKPRKVQVRTTHINGTMGRPQTMGRGGVKLEFSPLCPTEPNNNLNNTNNNTRPKPLPLINPRHGDYLLNRTHSTEGIASKLSLELKKKYLLGSSGISGNVKKSGSASTLDSKLNSFVDMISEHQKLLHPAPEPSPTMQAFLQGSSKLSAALNKPMLPMSPPLKLPPSPSQQSALLRKQKQLPPTPDAFKHVCGLEEVPTPSPATPTKEETRAPIEAISAMEEEADCRPRSPAHDTVIVVPEILWKIPQEALNDDDDEDMDSDSLSSSESDSLSDMDDDSDPRSTSPGVNESRTPPRVEIHNSHGQLMTEGGGIVEARNSLVGSLKLDSVDLPLSRTDSKVQPLSRTDSQQGKVETRPSDLGLKNDCGKLRVDLGRKPEGDSERSSPSTPPSESLQHEATLADTELSDWAQDTDAVVSEDLEDMEFNINPEFVTVRRHRKPKNVGRGGAKTLGGAQIARGEDFSLEDPGHVCGIDSGAFTASPLLSSLLDNIEFMDTGDEDSGTDDVLAATNHSLLGNRGYVKLVEYSEQQGSTTTEETTTSELATVRDSPLDPPPASESFPMPEPGYEDYARRLQGRISPFSNVRDSIDVRKSRRRNVRPVQSGAEQIKEEEVAQPLPPSPPSASDKLETTPQRHGARHEGAEQIQEDETRPHSFSYPSTSRKLEAGSRRRNVKQDRKEQIQDSPLTTSKVETILRISDTRQDGAERIQEEETPPQGHNSPSTSRKLEAISRERSKQKDLVHDMVMDKLNKSRPRRVRGSPSPELFYTPPTSFKRPVSVHHVSSLPDTPLTNPEAFSLPDIRKALFEDDEVFKTPVAPPRAAKHDSTRSTAERDKARAEARVRARLKSDEELGLSPEDYIAVLREKVRRGSESSIGRVSGPSEDSQLSDSRLSPDQDSVPFQPLQTSPSVCTSSPASPMSGPNSKTTFYLDADSNDGRKKSKDRERRKSIIQAVSDFFHKKKESSASPSPPKTPTSGAHSTRDKFSKFKFAKSKDKNKSPYSSWSDDSDQEKLLSHGKSEPSGSKGIGGARGASSFHAFTGEVEPLPPPIPPPPVNYVGNGSSSRMSEDSLSEAEEDSRAPSTPTHERISSVDGTTASLNRRHKTNRRVARQAQLKRLRMAQEIQRQLEEVEVKQRELEQRGVSVEKALRGEDTEAAEGLDEEAALLREWFDLMRERSELRRFEKELMVRAQEIELEDRHDRLQLELRERMSKEDATKTGEDVVQEGHILSELMEIVERRDSLIAVLEEDRQRYQEEDRDLEAQMLAKGIRLTPIRKESYV